jgi:hypothetical protein
MNYNPFGITGKFVNPLEKSSLFLTWLLIFCQREKAPPPLSEFPSGRILSGQIFFRGFGFRGILKDSKKPLRWGLASGVDFQSLVRSPGAYLRR